MASDSDSTMMERVKEYFPAREDGIQVMHRVVTRRRIGFALGLTVLGWAFALLVEGRYSAWLAATIFLGSFLIDEIRAIPISREDAHLLWIGEIKIVENGAYATALFVPTLVAAQAADVRVVFSLFVLAPIMSMYALRLLPETFPYRSMKDIPVVNDALLAIGAALFLLSGVLFFNQTPSSIGMAALISILIIRFFIGFSIGDIGAEQKRGGLFDDPRPPANLPEQFGSQATKHALAVLNAISFILFGALIAFQYLSPIAAFPIISYLFGFVFIAFVNPQNTDQMARYYWIMDTYVFFLFTVLGWISFHYGAI